MNGFVKVTLSSVQIAKIRNDYFNMYVLINKRVNCTIKKVYGFGLFQSVKEDPVSLRNFKSSVPFGLNFFGWEGSYCYDLNNEGKALIQLYRLSLSNDEIYIDSSASALLSERYQ